MGVDSSGDVGRGGSARRDGVTARRLFDMFSHLLGW